MCSYKKNHHQFNHYEFAIIPIDEANDNVAFICRQFYALLLLKELGLEQNRTSINQIYIQVNKTNNQEKQFDLSEVEHFRKAI